MKTNSTITRIIFLLCLLAACSPQKKRTDAPEIEEKNRSKLEQFLLLPTDSIYDLCDLTNDSISEFPDLSAYTIHKLNLSYNQIEKINTHFFPKKIQTVNLSHNHLRHVLQFREMSDSAIIDLKELNVSHNRLKGIDIYMDVRLFNIKRIIASHNDIVHLKFLIDLNFLDISYNPNLKKIVRFDPDLVDTLLHEGVANGEKLVFISSFIVNKLSKQNKRKYEK